MKSTISTLLILLFTFQILQSQVTEPLTEKSPQESYNYFHLKQKKQKIGAWVCIGSGIIMTFTGLAINSTDEALESLTLHLIEIEEAHQGDWLIYLGSATTIASIPLFISAGKNKRKAYAVMKTGTAGVGNITFDNSKYVSIGLKIDF